MYPCVNGINGGRYAYNNLQMFDNTWYHKFNATWHMATEAWYMYQRDVPSVSGPVATGKGHQRRVLLPRARSAAFAPEWATVNYVEKQLSAKNYLSIRSDFLDDMKGQRTGYQDSLRGGDSDVGTLGGKHRAVSSRTQIRSRSRSARV